MLVSAIIQKIEIVLGIDIGTVKISWVALNAQTGAEIERGTKQHNGNPRNVIRRLDKELEKKYCILNVVTSGSMSDLFMKPVLRVPEQAAQQEAAKFFFRFGSYNILQLGGRGFSLLTYNDGEFSYTPNDRCSTGTGTAIERLCQSRFGLTVEEACLEALSAEKWYPMAARCSVFLKSEITHLANQGHLRDEILKSYFYALAQNIWSLVEKRKVQGDLLLIGGVCGNQPLVNRIAELFDSNVRILEERDFFEAIGAARIALSQQRNQIPIKLTECLSVSKKKIGNFTPLSSYLNRVIKYEAIEVDITTFFGKRVIIGLDLGSTGSKITVIDVETGEVIYTSYTDTNGNPISASQELIRNVPPQLLQKVIGIGLTGSGRDTVAPVLQAIFPSIAGKIIVKTEILAHAAGACSIDHDNGESITVIEIGGQDAKYTLVIGGEVVDSEMNKACAAGTGSFLGEQASLYQIAIQEFGRLALGAEHPANMGQHCTVFIAELARQALQEGYSLPEIFAGFYYSIVYNYINRVMGKRILGEKIFLQGTPANNLSLAAAFVALMDREVIVPANPGAMGAIGIALITREEIEKVQEDQYFNLAEFLEAKVVSRSSFQCRDTSCGNGCIINKVVVEVNGQEYISLNGGTCPKYEKSKKTKLPQGAPNPFHQRSELLQHILQPILKDDSSQLTVAIPVGMGLVRFVPFFSHFFHELGLNIRLIWSNKDTIEKGDRRCSSPDMCAPLKEILGLYLGKGFRYYFLPKIHNLPLIGTEEGSCVCPIGQSAADIVEHAVDTSDVVFLKPVLDFSGGIDSKDVREALFNLGKKLCIDPTIVQHAFEKAVDAQNRFQRELLNIGKAALRYAKDNNLPVVLVCGRLYVITDPILNSGIPEEIQKNGAIALSIDCYPTPKNTPILDIMYWGEGERILRAILDVLMQDNNNVFPLWISCYGCGPDSFLEHFFNRLAQKYPHIILETDGHFGTAGYTTRIQAFLDGCFRYLKKLQRKALLPDFSHFNSVQLIIPSGNDVEIIFPYMGDGNRGLAAVFNSIGRKAIALPPISRKDFMSGKDKCSGKECLPFILLLGSILEYLANNDDGSEKVFFVPTTNGPCRFCMYHIRIRQVLEDIFGKDVAKRIHLLSPTTANSYNVGLSNTVRLKMWASVVVFDLLRRMLHHVRPIALDPEYAEGIYNSFMSECIKVLEKPSGTWLNSWGLEKLIREAATLFSAVPIDYVKANNIIIFAVVGEIYVRGVEFANDYLIKTLESLGMRALLATNSEWINYVGWCDIESGWWNAHKEKWSRRLFERKLYNICAKILGWPHDHPIEDVIKAGMPYLGSVPQGEAILGIGSAILLHNRKEVVATVIVGPSGCMPTKITEEILNQLKIPCITVYCDGEPIDENRLAAFAWQIGGRKSLAF